MVHPPHGEQFVDGQYLQQFRSHMEDFSHLPVIRVRVMEPRLGRPHYCTASELEDHEARVNPYLHIKQTFNMYPLVQVNTFNFRVN